MTFTIATPTQAARLTIPLMKTRKPPSPTTQSLLTMKKSATPLSTARKTFDSTVAEMHLSSINQNLIVNQILNNTHLVLMTQINNYIMLTYQTLCKYKQTKSNNKLKHIHFIPIIFVKLVIPEGKKNRQSKTRLVKALYDSGASESILAKGKADKLPVKNTKQEQQWSTADGVLTTNTKTSTSFSFPELHANKLINQSQHVVNINIDRCNMIIGRDLIISLGIDINDADINILWGDAGTYISQQTMYFCYCNTTHLSTLKPIE